MVAEVTDRPRKLAPKTSARRFCNAGVGCLQIWDLRCRYPSCCARMAELRAVTPGLRCLWCTCDYKRGNHKPGRIPSRLNLASWPTQTCAWCYVHVARACSTAVHSLREFRFSRYSARGRARLPSGVTFHAKLL